MKIAATIMVLALVPFGVGMSRNNFKLAEMGIGMLIIGALIAIWS